MSWFGGNNVNTQELEDKILEATSESIPNGEFDVSVAFEITDMIRSKKYPPKQCMRALKKRLTSTFQNPNLVTSTLKLIDVCVKNGGYHFLVELSSKEFMDYLVDFIFLGNYNVNDYKVMSDQAKVDVGTLILTLVKNWSIFFQNQLQLNYVEKCYKELINKGFQFPDTDTSDYNGNFIDTEAPADWVDNDECMICYKPFSMMNRKHHCRSCGGVFCQEHSSKTAPLPQLGIMEPVRVCDNCHFKLKYKLNDNSNLALKKNKSKSKHKSRGADDEEEADDDLKKAIELSLKESGGIEAVGPPAEPPQSMQAPAENNGPEEEDEEMKAAIAASLKEFEQQEKMYKSQASSAAPAIHEAPAAEEQSNFYNNILPSFGGQDAQVSSNQTTGPPQTRFQGMTPSSHIEKHRKMEDLTQKEEESLNLYITLINQIKTDKARQLNILYDKDLNDLHSQIIQIKPKLNKTLRSAIENYESFVALNNKLSTITRLYDQFLESKLSQAYGNHTIYSPYPMENNQPYYQSPPAGYSPQTTEPQYNGQQSTGPQYTGQQYNAPQSTGPQSTGPQAVEQQYTGQAAYPVAQYNQYGGQQFAAPNHTGPANQQYGQPNEPQYTGQESEPNFEESEPPQAPMGSRTTSMSMSQPPGQYAPYGGYKSPESPSEPAPSHSQAPIPSQPSYSAEYSHMSAYPPVENLGYPNGSPEMSYNSPDPSYPPPQPQTSNGTGASLDSTRSRYPPIDQISQQYPASPPSHTNSQPNSQPNSQQQHEQQFPSAPSGAPSQPPTTFNQEPTKTQQDSQRVEEPLIDL